MAKETLEDLFYETLKQIYYAEKRLVEQLPIMTSITSAPSLKLTLEEHLSETRIHIERLDQAFIIIGRRAIDRKCETIDSILKEAEILAVEIKDRFTRDVAIVSAVQSIKHHEIASYGSLAAWAKQLGQTDVSGLLEATLEEEKDTDKKLSGLADDNINALAAAPRTCEREHN